MSGSSNLLELDSWLQTTHDGIIAMQELEIDQFSILEPKTVVLSCLHEAITVLRNIVVDHLAASVEQR